MRYAAYDDASIYALGDSPEEAIENARRDARDLGAQFQTAPIADYLADEIEANGWNGKFDTFASTRAATSFAAETKRDGQRHHTLSRP